MRKENVRSRKGRILDLREAGLISCCCGMRLSISSLMDRSWTRGPPAGAALGQDARSFPARGTRAGHPERNWSWAIDGIQARGHPARRSPSGNRSTAIDDFWVWVIDRDGGAGAPAPARKPGRRSAAQVSGRNDEVVMITDVAAIMSETARLDIQGLDVETFRIRIRTEVSFLLWEDISRGVRRLSLSMKISMKSLCAKIAGAQASCRTGASAKAVAGSRAQRCRTAVASLRLAA